MKKKEEAAIFVTRYQTRKCLSDQFSLHRGGGGRDSLQGTIEDPFFFQIRPNFLTNFLDLT